MRYVKSMMGKGVLVLFMGISVMCAEQRDAHDIFGKWIDESAGFKQFIYHDVNIETMVKELTPAYTTLFQKHFAYNRDWLNTYSNFLIKVHLHPLLLVNRPAFDGILPETKESLSHLYHFIQHDVGGFIDYLKTCGLEDVLLNQQEQGMCFHDVIDKHKYLMSVLFLQEDARRQMQYLVSVANHFFEYCFYLKTWKTFKSLLEKPEDFPITRLLYSTMWYFLAGSGWKDWHYNTLVTLQKAARDGKQIVYIAGGSDIYQLLDYGIYNITVIDPLLPSQLRYYSEGWEWLIKGDGNRCGVGDELTCVCQNKDLVLRRKMYKEDGVFEAQLSTGTCGSLPKSKTVWDVCDRKSNRKLGAITFERRFCTQSDFKSDPRRVLLMSFNELYYVTTKNMLDTWNIDPQKFSENFQLCVKQLRKPINKVVACNLLEADRAPFKFIKLGTAIN